MLRRALLSVALAGVSVVIPVCSATASGCSNEVLRPTLHSVGLPDCRAYELVSPTVKYGWPVVVQRLSFGGDRAVAYSLGGFPGSDQVSLLSFYEFVREPGGWSSVPLNAPSGYDTGQYGGVLPAASPELTAGVSEYRQPSATDQRDTAYYVRPLPSGLAAEAGPRFSRQALESVTATEHLSTGEAAPSSDLSHVLFMLGGPQFAHGRLVDTVWPSDTTALKPLGEGWASLYEYVGTGNSAPSLVGVNGNGHLISECGTTLGYPENGHFTTFQGGELFNAVSAPSGSRIFFTVAGGPCEEGGTGPPTSELYAREEQSPGVLRSIPISEPTSGAEGDCTACDTSNPQPATFQGASEDGSRVFFLSDQHLLEGAEGKNLYMYDFNAQKGRRVLLAASGVQGVSRVSGDGSHVYFVAGTVLTNATNPLGDSAHTGADNLYVYDSDTGLISFVGSLAAEDTSDWQVQDERPVDASADGKTVVFTSSADLTHEGTAGLVQVFKYDMQTDTLVRVSRPQGGFGGVFPAGIVYPRYTGHFDPSPQSSSVSSDGTVTVFQSEAALTSQAILGYNNIYEYRSGRVSLISDGQDRSHRDEGFPSVSLLGVDGSGRDIFFTTADQLVPGDGDTQEDVYDARAGGGFPSETSTTCDSEDCQGPLAPTPVIASAYSVTQPAGEQATEQPAIHVVKAKPKRKIKKAKHARKIKRAQRARRAHGKHAHRSARG
jgi:hypothetical protein